MKKKYEDLLEWIGNLLGCLILVLTGITIFIILFYSDKIKHYIFSNPLLFIGLVILSFIIYIILFLRESPPK